MQSVKDLLESRAKELSNKTYLEFQDQRFTYEQMNQKANQACMGFQALGLKKGDVIALMVKNSPEFIFLWWGILKLGAIMNPINLRLTAKETSYILNHSQAKAVVVGTQSLDILPDLKENCLHVKHWLGLEHVNDRNMDLAWDFFKENETQDPDIDIAFDDPAVILYTSGTTGFPKAVVHTQGNYLKTASSFAKTCGLNPMDRLLTANPLFHVNAQFYSAMGCLWARATFCLAEKFSASRMWQWTRDHKANKAVMLLALTTILYGRPPSDDDADNPLELIVAGGAPKGCYHDFEKRFGVKLQTLYSLSEAPLAIMSPLSQPCVDGAVGMAMTPGWPGLSNQVIVGKKDNKPCKPHETGEILIRNQALFLHYYKDPLATEKAMNNGFLHTGDMGKVDENGWIYFLGREKDVIRKKGENISPAQVEGVLTAHPKVSEAAVIGVSPKDALGEEEVMAFVVGASTDDIDWHDLKAHCLDNLADFKVPRYWLKVEALPKNATNRVVKKELKKNPHPETGKDVFDSDKDIRGQK